MQNLRGVNMIKREDIKGFKIPLIKKYNLSKKLKKSMVGTNLCFIYTSRQTGTSGVRLCDRYFFLLM